MTDRNDRAHRAGYEFGYRVLGPALGIIGIAAVVSALGIGFGYLVGAW